MISNHSIECLADDTLLSHAKLLAAEERAVTAKLLRHLLEIEKRLLFAKLGFSSLFQYVTEELGFCAASAHARIASMRLLAVVPEIEEKIISGSVSLTNLAQAQRFFNHQRKENHHDYSPSQKKQVIEQLEGKSTRDAEKELIGLSSNPESFARPDQIRPVTPTLSEVRFTVDQNLLDQLEQIRGLLAHQNANLTMAELIAKMAAVTLEKLQAARFATLKKKTIPSELLTPAGTAPLEKSALSETSTMSKTPITSPAKTEQKNPIRNTRTIPRAVQRAVFERDGFQCCYHDPATKRRCESQFALELDHVIPFAKGGPSTMENLITKCAAHNAWAAIQEFGQQRMQIHRKQKIRQRSLEKHEMAQPNDSSRPQLMVSALARRCHHRRLRRSPDAT